MNNSFSAAWERGKIRMPFRYLQTGQETVNLNAASLQTQEREAVEVSLPISMHTGQIILLTKMLISSDLRFYDIENGVPVETWHSGPSNVF